MKRCFPRRRATVAVVVSVCLTILLGAAAFAIDGGMTQQNRRNVQAAADASALAAADDLFQRYTTNSGLDVGGNAATKTKALASANGYNNDGTTNTVTVNI